MPAKQVYVEVKKEISGQIRCLCLAYNSRKSVNQDVIIFVSIFVHQLVYPVSSQSFGIM